MKQYEDLLALTLKRVQVEPLCACVPHERICAFHYLASKKEKK